MGHWLHRIPYQKWEIVNHHHHSPSQILRAPAPYNSLVIVRLIFRKFTTSFNIKAGRTFSIFVTQIEQLFPKQLQFIYYSKFIVTLCSCHDKNLSFIYLILGEKEKRRFNKYIWEMKIENPLQAETVQNIPYVHRVHQWPFILIKIATTWQSAI